MHSTVISSKLQLINKYCNTIIVYTLSINFLSIPLMGISKPHHTKAKTNQNQKLLRPQFQALALSMQAKIGRRGGEWVNKGKQKRLHLEVNLVSNGYCTFPWLMRWLNKSIYCIYKLQLIHPTQSIFIIADLPSTKFKLLTQKICAQLYEVNPPQ